MDLITCGEKVGFIKRRLHTEMITGYHFPPSLATHQEFTQIIESVITLSWPKLFTP